MAKEPSDAGEQKMRGETDRGKAKDQEQQPDRNRNRAKHDPSLVDRRPPAMHLLFGQMFRGMRGCAAPTTPAPQRGD